MRALGRAASSDGWLLAVSGGPDSMALLAMAAALGGRDMLAVTVDHGIRPESADEARLVAVEARRLGVLHQTRRIDLIGRGNVAQRARTARYDALEEARRAHGLAWTLTAHHGDDQLETLAMRLARGSGVRGLAAIRATAGPVTRPLLDWRRAELRAVVEASGMAWCADPSNVDPRRDRTRWRQALAALPFSPGRIGRTTRACAEAADALEWAAARLVEDWKPGTMGPFAADTPVGIRRVAIEAALAALSPPINPTGPQLDRLLAAMAAGATTTIGAWTISRDPRGRVSSVWRVEPSAPRRARLR